MCAATLCGGPLVCVRTDDHEPHHGCCYEASAGADLSGEVGGDE